MSNINIMSNINVCQYNNVSNIKKYQYSIMIEMTVMCVCVKCVIFYWYNDINLLLNTSNAIQCNVY